MEVSRIIGKYRGSKPGPLLVCFGGIHGNEPAGARALDLVFKMLEVEPITNPEFVFHGDIIGLLGNIEALKLGKRYIDKDLNRLWTKENRERILNTPDCELVYKEEHELKALIITLEKEIKEINPSEIIFLDLHTTTATGGIFSIVSSSKRGLRIAKELHAPVVLGMEKGLRGTTHEYFDDESWSVPTEGIIFESGQHQDPLSVNRAIAAIINCMRTIGNIDPTVVENRHDELLTTFSENLPKVTQLEYWHRIKDEDDFHMLPGFKNFQKVVEGQLLAHDKTGPIYAPNSGLILMPLYQSQGEDGFFIIQAEEATVVL
jgi:succinylglutamate desuccinylase